MKKTIQLISILIIGTYMCANAQETLGGGGVETVKGGGNSTSGSSATGTGSSAGTDTGTNTNTNTNGSGTGITEQGSLSLTQMVFPNPTNGDLFITPSISNQISNVKLYNTNGSIVYETNDKIQRVDLRPYPAGIYYLQVTTNHSEKYLNKVIKGLE